ncbi:MAG: molecular chaperone GrpE [Kosmotogales bacterium]|nr:molecular chaperone GrpE [Kosmotogales bacterium]
MSDKNRKKKIIKEELKENNEKEIKETDEKEEKIIEKYKEAIQEKESEIIELNNQINRLRAEFVDYKKILKRESDVIVNSHIEKMILKIIDILNHFNIALSHSDNVDKNFVTGMKMIYKSLDLILENQNVKKIVPEIGEPFDPFATEVVETVITDEFEDMSVIKVKEIGYKLNGKILKPAKVDVAMKPKEVKVVASPDLKNEIEESNNEKENENNNQEQFDN